MLSVSKEHSEEMLCDTPSAERRMGHGGEGLWMACYLQWCLWQGFILLICLSYCKIIVLPSRCLLSYQGHQPNKQAPAELSQSLAQAGVLQQEGSSQAGCVNHRLLQHLKDSPQVQEFQTLQSFRFITVLWEVPRGTAPHSSMSPAAKPSRTRAQLRQELQEAAAVLTFPVKHCWHTATARAEGGSVINAQRTAQCTFSKSVAQLGTRIFFSLALTWRKS